MPMPKPDAPFKFGIAAKRAQAEAQLAEIKPENCPHKLAIIFDDSGSMAGESLAKAKEAVRTFTTSCNPLETALAVVPLSVSEGHKEKAKPITVNYDVLNLFVSSLQVSGGTPLYQTMIDVLKAEIKPTRLIAFSDGEPTDDYYKNADSPTKKGEWLQTATEAKLPHDTVYIGMENTLGYNEMKWIAEQTGGIFIHFKDAKSLASGLKYLSPGLRGLLTNAETKAKIQKGETI